MAKRGPKPKTSDIEQKEETKMTKSNEINLAKLEKIEATSRGIDGANAIKPQNAFSMVPPEYLAGGRLDFHWAKPLSIEKYKQRGYFFPNEVDLDNRVKGGLHLMLITKERKQANRVAKYDYVAKRAGVEIDTIAGQAAEEASGVVDAQGKTAASIERV